ncbi:MAG TPA: 2-oxoglutarate dehydrogenase complex dihydrolipoyllysine-residue succinyltransferase [Terriglobia bacterium]|nr:2-oxoglutarate dehydrogenase complex dihydrolipoyllysine-residue succinyltransferase [Terriglobia bacterium]
MPSRIVVPELGESVVEATVGHWLKHEGDRVSVGETLVSLETDKVDLEVAAERNGVLTRVERKEGEDVKIGDVLGVIEDAVGEAAVPAPAPSEPGAGGGGGDTAATGVGAPKPSPSATVSSEVIFSGPTVLSPSGPSEKGAGGEGATPSARRAAREREVDLAAVRPHDETGRITKEDVERYAKKVEVGPAEVVAPAPAPVAAPGPLAVAPGAASDRAALEERVRMSRRRQTIARRLVEAQHTAAMLTTFNEIDMGAVMELRQRHKESFKERHSVSLGISSFFVKAAIGALRQFPRLNAEIQGDEIVLKHYYDIGVALGAPEGLVVPVLRDADRMSFAAIEIAIKQFAQKSANSTLSLDDLRGGTFTITNGGVFGSLMSTPILNPPQVGILGLHKIQERPVSRQGQIVTRPMMYVALSYDHRLVDGLEAVQFLVKVKELVEDPASMLIEG